MSILLYLIRHGETQWNRQKLLQGSRDIPLNEAGLSLARRTAEGLQKAGLRFDRVYSSPLSRAWTTAQILCPGQAITKDDRLREISFGDWEGAVCQDLTAIPLPPPGGEGVDALQSRVLSFLRDVTADPENQGKTLLVSTHGAAIRSVVMALGGVPLEDFWKGPVSKNCGVTILAAEDGQLSLVRENVIFYE